MEYVCLCNGITDEDVRRAVCRGARRPKDVYESGGHRAQCGKCTRDILSLLRSLSPTPPRWAFGAEMRA